MIGRVRDRTTFAALRSQGVRARSGPFTVTFVPDALAPAPPGSPPARVAFAVPRRVGRAVDRNLIRRRIRSILGDLPQDRLPVGAYLIAVRPGATPLSFSELSDHVDRALCDTVKRASNRATPRTPSNDASQPAPR